MSIVGQLIYVSKPQKMLHHVIGLGCGNIKKKRPMTRSKFQVLALLLNVGAPGASH